MKTKSIPDRDSFDKLIGHRLSELRERFQLTQEDAAKVLGVSRATMTLIECGNRQLLLMEAMRLADAYGMTMTEFTRNVKPNSVAPRRCLRKKPDFKTLEYVENLIIVLKKDADRLKQGKRVRRGEGVSLDNNAMAEVI